jgi:F0F1-type ATP synthase beta subunit
MDANAHGKPLGKVWDWHEQLMCRAVRFIAARRDGNFSTGIKVIDLLTPLAQGGRVRRRRRW